MFQSNQPKTRENILLFYLPGKGIEPKTFQYWENNDAESAWTPTAYSPPAPGPHATCPPSTPGTPWPPADCHLYILFDPTQVYLILVNLIAT